MASKRYSLVLGVSLRFLRAFVAGFVSTALTVSLANVQTWTELGTALSAVTLCGVIGGISGLLMAADKYLRSE